MAYRTRTRGVTAITARRPASSKLGVQVDLVRSVRHGLSLMVSNDYHSRIPVNHPTINEFSQDRRTQAERDQGVFDYVPAFPSQSPARTTFHDPDDPDDRRWERLWRFQHGRGHAWDGSGKTTARNDYTARRCKAILQQCEVPKWAESYAVDRVFRVNLNGFSRYYAGTDGACVGFALTALYDGPETAKQSFHAKRVPDVVPGLDADDVRGLVDYVFRKYGGEA